MIDIKHLREMCTQFETLGISADPIEPIRNRIRIWELEEEVEQYSKRLTWVWLFLRRPVIEDCDLEIFTHSQNIEEVNTLVDAAIELDEDDDE